MYIYVFVCVYICVCVCVCVCVFVFVCVCVYAIFARQVKAGYLESGDFLFSPQSSTKATQFEHPRLKHP